MILGQSVQKTNSKFFEVLHLDLEDPKQSKSDKTTTTKKEKGEPTPFIKSLLGGASVLPRAESDCWPTVLSREVVKNLILVGTVIIITERN